MCVCVRALQRSARGGLLLFLACFIMKPTPLTALSCPLSFKRSPHHTLRAGACSLHSLIISMISADACFGPSVPSFQFCLPASEAWKIQVPWPAGSYEYSRGHEFKKSNILWHFRAIPRHEA